MIVEQRAEHAPIMVSVKPSPLVSGELRSVPELVKENPDQVISRLSHVQQLNFNLYFTDSKGTGLETYTYGNLNNNPKEVVRYFANLGNKDLKSLASFIGDSDVQSIADPVLEKGVPYGKLLNNKGQYRVLRDILFFEDVSIAAIKAQLEPFMSSEARLLRDKRHERIGDPVRSYRVVIDNNGISHVEMILPQEEGAYNISPQSLREIFSQITFQEQRGYRHTQALFGGVLPGFLTRQSIEIFSKIYQN